MLRRASDEHFKKLRVKAVTRRQPIGHGYIGTEEVRVQFLQRRRWWGWQTIDEEMVPNAVLIALGATGYDSSGWRSKFVSLGRFGSDGIIIPAP